MTSIRLFGTLTSPYVRRVRAIALELGLEYSWTDTSTDQGQQALRIVSPIGKIPVVEIDGKVLMDSRIIGEHWLRQHGPGPFAPLDREGHNIHTVIDGATDALINTFYLSQDGLTADSAAYIRKQHERAASAMAWLDSQVDDVWLTSTKCFGVPELALCTSMEWMRYRNTYPVERHPRLLRCIEYHGVRPSLETTRLPD